MLKLSDRLKLFKADLQEEGSFDEAVRGCDGVFHVAASMEFGVQPNHNIGNLFKLLMDMNKLNTYVVGNSMVSACTRACKSTVPLENGDV